MGPVRKDGRNSSAPRELYDAESAARFLGLFSADGQPSASAVYHMKHRGQFQGYGVVVQIGRRTLYARAGLIRFIEAHTV